MKLKELIKNIEVTKTTGDLDVDIKDIAYDSRKVKSGTLFVAIKGEKADGHDYLNDAVANGASAIMCSKNTEGLSIASVVTNDTQPALALASSELFRHPSREMDVIGVTGTNGKTTISFLVESVLAAAGKTSGVIGTVNWRWQKTELPAPNTTPMSYDLQKLLRQMADGGVKDIVMEVSSHALDQGRVKGVDFDAAIFTNLTHDHLDYHLDIENYYKAKESFFTDYLSGSRKTKKIAVINIDDEYGKRLVDRLTDRQVNKLTYSVKEKADVSVKGLKSLLEGNKFRVMTPWGEIEINSALKGKFNVSNILATVACMGALSYPPDVIKKGIEALKCVPGRFEDVPNKKGIHAFVDYSHTPDALKNVLTSMREISKGRIITVFGCGGDRDRSKRPVMGEVAASLSDEVIVTSDNPRSENPLFIIGEITAGVKRAGSAEFVVEPDRAKAIEKAVLMAKKGDIVLVAGKGHENYQIIGNEKKHFDDREELSKCLSA